MKLIGCVFTKPLKLFGLTVELNSVSSSMEGITMELKNGTLHIRKAGSDLEERVHPQGIACTRWRDEP